MSEQQRLIQLLKLYGSDADRWPEEDQHLGDPDMFDPFTLEVWREARRLDQRLSEDVIPNRSSELRRRIHDLISAPPTTFMERWLLPFTEPWRPALVHALILSLGVLTSDLIQDSGFVDSTDYDDAIVWAAQYLGDTQP
jgi:hypothetical protein